MGRNWVKVPVISMTRIIPVTGARTTAVKNAAIPTTANSVGLVATPGSKLPQRIPKSGKQEHRDLVTDQTPPARYH